MSLLSDFTLQLRCEYIDGGDGPSARSAHNCVLGPQQVMCLAAGDSGTAGKRFSDAWQLSGRPGSYIWQQLGRQNANDDQEHQQSCTPRSNAAAVGTEDWLLLFGGWSSTGLEPLACLQAFSFSTSTWLSPRPTGQGPSPRGQPAAAANTAGTAMYLFGGWDGTKRYNDLFKLLLNGDSADSWEWEQVTPMVAPPKGARAGITFQQQQQAQQQQQVQQPPAQQQQQQALQLPCERADHVMVCWHYCDDGVWKDLLVVFGGSCSDGLLNDTWLFDVNTSSWTQAFSGGGQPCPRSSSAAAITGDVLLIHGGQTPAGVLHDMHLLNLSTLTWLQVDLGPVLQPLCRHSMVITDDTCLIFGGYDGATASSQLLQIDLQPVLQLQRSSVQDLISCMACCGGGSGRSLCSVADKTGRSGSDTSPAPGAKAAAGAEALVGVHMGDEDQSEGTLKAVGVVPRAAVLLVPPVVKALSKKASPPPLKLSDLPNAEEVAAMPQWKQVRQLHQAALSAGCDQYIDPKTGYTVFTAHYLQQRPCCGNKCRHCPHGWVNVAKHRLQPPAPAAAAGAGAGGATAVSGTLDW